MSLNGNSGFSQHCAESSGIPPGACFDYIFTVGEQTGTYWIHSHVIGQYPNGLRAPFIVHDCDPPYHYDEEIVLSVSDWVCLCQYFLTCSTIKRCRYSFRNSCRLKTRMVQSPFPIVKPLSLFTFLISRCVDLGPPKWHTKCHTRHHRSIPSSQHWCVRILPLLDRVTHFDCHRS